MFIFIYIDIDMPTRKCAENQILRRRFTRLGKRYSAKCIRRVSPYLERHSAYVKRITGKMTRRLRGLTKERRGNTLKCEVGFTLRKAYVRYSTKGSRKLVKGACITRRGSGVTGAKIGPLRKGEMSRFGYVKIDTLSISRRRIALKAAVKELGSLSVWKKLNVLYVFNKNTNKALAKKFNADKDWVRATYGLKAF